MAVYLQFSPVGISYRDTESDGGKLRIV